jgi:putative photosynthetic complex assembly protein 2
MTLQDTALAVLFAVFIWWFSTGIVLLLDGLQRRARRTSLVVASGLGLLALLALAGSSRHTGAASVYCAFTSALLVWGWHEMTFLAGWITGPRRVPLATGAAGWPRVRQAVQAVLWHEISIASVGLAIVVLTWDAPNPVGLWTYLVLWAMRSSAKLNLFLGVRNHSEEFLPERLAHLPSYFRRRRLNPLMPVSLLGGTAVLLAMAAAASADTTPPAAALGLVLAGTMLAMALVEHALLVLPLSPTALWRWALRGRDRLMPHPQATAPVAQAVDPAPPSSPHAKLLQPR